MIILSWLNDDLPQFKPCVGNQVAHSSDNLLSNQCKLVSDDDNPADYASRGLSPGV